MDAINLADAKVHLSEFVERVEAGDLIKIGKSLARLSSVARPRQRIDATVLQALTLTMPPSQDAADLVRTMRDSDCY